MSQTPEVLVGSKTQAEISLEARALYDTLRALQVGEEVTYKELNRIAGRNVQHEGRSSLVTARKMCQCEHQMVFSPVRGEGLRRLTDSEIVEGADGDISRIRKAAKRGAEKLACAVYENLQADEKPAFSAKAAILGTLIQHSRPEQIKQIERFYANEAKPVLPGAGAHRP